MYSSVKNFQSQDQNCYILVKQWYTYCMAKLVRDEKEIYIISRLKKTIGFSLCWSCSFFLQVYGPP